MVSAPWLYAWIALALLLMVVQFFLTPGYGRHATSRWGPGVPNRLGWVVMESVALLACWLGWWHAGRNAAMLTGVALLLWSLHYVHRAWIYPLRTRTRGKRMPLLIMLAAVCFNGVNGGLIGASLGSDSGDGQITQLQLSSVIGVLLFAVGAVINIRADNTLLALRRQDDHSYHIPRGGLFQYVSCPNFLGEIVQWTGFALFCWNLPAAAFAVWTAANLVPRAIAHHRWYRREFEDYPAQRKALVPWLL